MPSAELQSRNQETAPGIGYFEQDLGVQQLFMTGLETVRKDDIQELPVFVDHINHEGRLAEGLEDAVQPGLHLTHEFMTWCKEQGQQLPDRFSFAPQNLLRLGRENSRRKVFFGSLELDWFGRGGSHEAVTVGVKPADEGGSRKLMHECAMYQYLEAEGIPSLEVMGILVLDQEPHQRRQPDRYLITRFQPSISTMDNIAWADLSEDAKWQELEPALDTLVMLHKDLLFHGDIEFKNVATGDVKGQRVVVDPELMASVKFAVHPSSDPQKIMRLMSVDFSSLHTSLNTFIFGTMPAGMRPQNDAEKFEIELQKLYLPYRERLTRLASGYQTVLLDAFDKMLDQKARQASGGW